MSHSWASFPDACAVAVGVWVVSSFTRSLIFRRWALRPRPHRSQLLTIPFSSCLSKGMSCPNYTSFNVLNNTRLTSRSNREGFPVRDMLKQSGCLFLSARRSRLSDPSFIYRLDSSVVDVDGRVFSARHTLRRARGEWRCKQMADADGVARPSAVYYY